MKSWTILTRFTWRDNMAKKPTKQYTDIHIQIDTEKEVKKAIKGLVSEERQRAFACERSRIDELDKAICQMQKDMRSLKVVINRIESAVESKK